MLCACPPVYGHCVLMIRQTALLAFLFLLASGARAQETRYVTDILQLGLFSNQEAAGQPLRNLVSGTELTVLERIPNFARVRTADGAEGWVKSAFLVAEKPAQLRVAEVEAEIAALERELEQARNAQHTAETSARQIVARAESELAAVHLDQAAMAALEQDNADYLQRLETYRGALPWPWVAAALVLALAGGFYAGYAWLDAAIRRRHGGFRVY